MISILIRTKNEAEYIDCTLRAIYDQDFTDFEILVVDSGSNDGTLEIIRKYPVPIYPIPEFAYTPGYSLNYGFERAKGQIFVSLSAHAVPANNRWLSNLVVPLKSSEVAAASSHQIPHLNQKLEPYLIFWQGVYEKNIQTRPVQRFLFSNASSAVKSSVWKEFPFNETIKTCEDHLWAKKIMRLGYRVVYQPSSVVYHSHRFTWRKMIKRRWNELGAQIRLSILIS